MYPADFLQKWGPKVGAERGEMASDLGAVVHARYDALRGLLTEAIEILEHSDPPEGGRTDQFIKRIKKALA